MSSASLQLLYTRLAILSPKRQHAGVCLYLQYDLQSPVSSHVIEYMMFLSQTRSIIQYSKRDSGNISSAVRKILQCDMLIIFLLFPYCFYNQKQEPNVLLKDKSSMSRCTDGLKVELQCSCTVSLSYAAHSLLQANLVSQDKPLLAGILTKCLINASICFRPCLHLVIRSVLVDWITSG